MWMAKLPPLPVGGPYTLTIAGPQAATLNNILVGDVWVCSGQSNMEFGMNYVLNSQTEVPAANYPNMRLFTVQRMTGNDPLLNPMEGAEYREIGGVQLAVVRHCECCRRVCYDVKRDWASYARMEFTLHKLSQHIIANRLHVASSHVVRALT